MADELEVDTDRLRVLARNFEQESRGALRTAGGLHVNAITPSELPGSQELAAAQVGAGVAFPKWAKDYCGSALFAAQFARAAGRSLEDIEWHAAQEVRREQIRGAVASALESVPLNDSRKPPDAAQSQAQAQSVL